MEENKGFKPNNNNQDLPNNNGNNKVRIIIYIVILVVLIGITFIDFGGGANEINWNKFENEMLMTNDVEKVVVVNRERADIYIKPESLDKFGGAGRGSSIFQVQHRHSTSTLAMWKLSRTNSLKHRRICRKNSM